MVSEKLILASGPPFWLNRHPWRFTFTSLPACKGRQKGSSPAWDGVDIDTVTEIFIRINSQGAPLSQADFVMSKISANESYGGNILRKTIDYFCHLAAVPSGI
jgi:hypothetical protein